jgi:polysaccharide chain length determinant protein (PEP-CTERM system associated)
MATNSEFGTGLGLPGLEHFTPKDYWRLLVRRRWQIILVTLVVGVLAALFARLLPSVYRATTTIMVDPRKVNDNLVSPSVSAGVADRLATLKTQVLSSTNLMSVMDEMNLYPELRKRKAPEELVNMMTRNIEILIAPPIERGEGTFRISFQSNNGSEAAAVTNRLASRFINNNVKERQQQVTGTAQFIDHELEDAKKDLQEKEEKIREIKSRYIADLPESQTLHVQALNSLQMDLRNESDAISRAQQQKVYYQSQMLAAPQVVDLDRSEQASEVVPLRMELAKAQSQLDNLRTRYGPDHPDVVKKTTEVKDLQRRIREAKEEGSDRQASKPAPKSSNPVLESQIAAIDEEIKTRTKRQADIQSQIAYHQSKLERIPVLEQQLASVNRDYENARDHYKLLLDRKFSADMSSSLEDFQKADRFIVLDPARAPARPFSPNRPLINGAGLALGLALGLILAVAFEMLDPSVKTSREVNELLGTTVLAEIPVLVTLQDENRMRFRNWMSASASIVFAVAFVLIALAPKA